MNALFLFWGRTAGGARYALEVGKALSNIPNLNLYLSLSRQSTCFEEFMALDLPGCHVDTYKSFGEMVWQAIKLPTYRHQLKKFIKEHKIELIYSPMTHIWNPAIVGLFQKLGVKYVLTMHDAMTHSGDMERLKNMLLRKDVLASDACITLTQTVKSGVHEAYAYPLEKIKVIPHGAFHYGDFEPRKFPVGRPLRLLFYGRILKYKGLNLLCDALKLLPNSLDVELEVWGDGDIGSYEEVLCAVQQKGITVRIENRWIKEEEIEDIFRETDVCVLPYVEASQSGVAAIAFATAMPIIATPQPGLVEQLEMGGGVVSESVTPQAFAEAITRVCGDPELYKKLSSGAHRQAEHELSWEKIGQDIACFLSNVQYFPCRK